MARLVRLLIIASPSSFAICFPESPEREWFAVFAAVGGEPMWRRNFDSAAFAATEAEFSRHDFR
jgi:hypothetical protein